MLPHSLQKRLALLFLVVSVGVVHTLNYLFLQRRLSRQHLLGWHLFLEMQYPEQCFLDPCLLACFLERRFLERSSFYLAFSQDMAYSLSTLLATAIKIARRISPICRAPFLNATRRFAPRSPVRIAGVRT